jgi:hypothetical protein
MQAHELTFNGALLVRGFWLYVWEITKPDGQKLYYVGRTGDSSSMNAQSPFNRMAHHLSLTGRANALRRYLGAKGVEVNPEECMFRLVAHGPMFEEAVDLDLHHKQRDIVAALEKALADAMRQAGYTVMNIVHCRKVVEADRFAEVLAAFASYFPALANPSHSQTSED